MRLSIKVLLLTVSGLTASTSWTSLPSFDPEENKNESPKTPLSFMDLQHEEMSSYLGQITALKANLATFSACKTGDLNEHLKAVAIWRDVIDLGHVFTKGDVTSCCFSLKEIKDYRVSYPIWGYLFKNYPEIVSSSYYADYARSAYFLKHYKQSSELITDYFSYGGEHKESALLTAALSFYELKDFSGAYPYFYELFNGNNTEDVMSFSFLGSVTAQMMNDHKMSLKWIRHYIENEADSKMNPSLYAYAANCAWSAGEVELAKKYWGICFSIQEERGAMIYYNASALFEHIGEFDKASEYLEMFFMKTPKEMWQPKDLLRIGYQYVAQGKIEQALNWYDCIFTKSTISCEETSLRLIAYLSDALVIYGLEGRQLKNVSLLLELLIKATLFHEMKTKAPVKIEVPQQNSKAIKNKGKNSQKSRANASLSVQEIHKKSHEILSQRHKSFCTRVNAMDFEKDSQDITLQQQLIGELESISKQLQGYCSIAPTKVTSKTNKQTSYVALQGMLTSLEPRLQALERKHSKLLEAKRKARVLAYFQTLACQEHEVMRAPENPNLKAHYGHGKEPKKEELLLSKEAKVTSTSSSTMTQQFAPKVSIKLLKSGKKQYDELQKMPGMFGKYQCFLKEIRENPLASTKGFGRPKKLVGDADVYARRFDKGNRFVYKVFKTEEDTYDVVILSLLGHYKELDHQLKTVNKNQKVNTNSH